MNQLDEEKYTNVAKSFFSMLKLIGNREEGTMIKVLFYLYSVYPESYTKTYVASHGRFDPTTVLLHIDEACSKGYLIKGDRSHCWGGKYIRHDAYRLTTAGIRYIDELFERIEVEVTVR